MKTKIETYQEILSDLIDKHVNKPLSLFYVGQIDDTKVSRSNRMKKGVLGYCSYSKKQIVIDVNHVNISTHDEIMDTILHEIAHARASYLHNDHGHGRMWKQECLYLGCTPRAKAKVSNELRQAIAGERKEPKWTIVYSNPNQVEIIKIGECSRRLKSIKIRYSPKLGKTKSLGKLFLVETCFYKNYVANKINHVQLMMQFVQ